ncbi:MAG: ATP-binding protein [Cyanobacteria bacterium P01_G01_bin.54]
MPQRIHPVTLAPAVAMPPLSPEWQGQNVSYLFEAIATIHATLDRYISRNRSGTEPEQTDATPSLAARATTLTPQPMLEQLVEIFGLTPFERSLLLCCAGQAIQPNFPKLLAIAHDDNALNYPTFQLALQCFAHPHWSALTEERPLRRWQLLRWVEHPELSRARLHIDEAILHLLMGEPYRDPALAAMVIPVAGPTVPIALQPSHQQILTQVVALLQAAQGRQPLVQLCGTERAVQGAIAQQVGEQLHCPVYQLEGSAIPSDRAELRQLIQRWQRWVKIRPSLLVVEIDPSLNQSSQPPLTTPFLQTVKVPLLVITDERLPLNHPVVVTFEVNGLRYSEQLQLWQAAWPDAPGEFQGDLARLASQFRLSAAMIQTASTTVQADPNLSTAEPNDCAQRSAIGDCAQRSAISDRLWDFCRAQARPKLEGLAQPITVNATWEDLILPPREKNLLRQIITHVRQQAQVYQAWGFAQQQRGLGLTALFAGISGTGKTTAAEILAHELKLDLFRIDLSAVISKYIGETEKNLRKIFDAAEVGGAILLFDEADALFGKRTQVRDSHDRHANIEVSYLLQRMEAYQGLAILTTNLKENLDQAFLRRLRFILNFPYPNAPERSQIWQRAFPKQTPTQGLDFERLGQLDVTGGNIKAIALNAAFLAAAAGQPVTMQHILAATKTEYWKLGRSLTNVEIRDWDVD